MSFTTEGDIPVQIRQITIAVSTLNQVPNSADICVDVVNEDGTQSDWWRSNISASLTQIKNRQGQTNTQVTYDNMVSLGYQGPDFSRWPNDPNVDWTAVQAAFDRMAGTVTSAHCKRSNCGRYINVKWLGVGSGNTPERLNLNQLSLMATPAQAAPQGGFGGGFGGAGQAQQQGGFGGQQAAPQGGFGSGFGR